MADTFKRKAFLFGVGDYGIESLRLEAAVREMREWARVLSDRFGFQVMRPLENEEATRDAVLEGYRTLVAGAQPNDQLFFVAVCHGTIRPRSRRRGPEQALVAFPTDGSLSAATIGMSEFEDVRVPRGTDLTFIFETCFAGARKLEQDPHAVPLFIPSDLVFGTFDFDVKSVRTFGSMKFTFIETAHNAMDGERKAVAEQPLIVAASGPFQGAYQTTIGREKRMVFSYLALPPLDKNVPPNDRPTFDRWIKDIKPLRPGFPQVPKLAGNEGRYNERFPGAPANENFTETPPNHGHQRPKPGPDQTETLMSSGPSSLAVDIAGICCFVNVYPDRKRLVLPYDGMGHGHIAFLEIAVEDIADIKGSGPSTPEYPHFEFVANPDAMPPVETLPGMIAYFRWNLAGHKVTFSSIDTGQTLTVTGAYGRHVPQMKKVLPELDNYPRPECFQDAPRANLIAAYMDIANGVLDVADLEERPLVFDPMKEWPPVQPPTSVRLRLPITQPFTTITITNTATGANEHEITLKPTATLIRMGNLMIQDIEGPGSGLLSEPEHFLLYYELSGKELTEKPIPSDTAAPVNSCSVTNWP